MMEKKFELFVSQCMYWKMECWRKASTW